MKTINQSFEDADFYKLQEIKNRSGLSWGVFFVKAAEVLAEKEEMNGMIFDECVEAGDTIEIKMADHLVTGEVIDITDDVIFLENSNQVQLFVSVEKIQWIKIVKHAEDKEKSNKGASKHGIQ